MKRTMNPGAELDFVFDWNAAAPIGPWLATGETISSYTATCDSPLVKLSDSESSSDVTVWVRMPSDAQIGAVGYINCAIVTSAGRKDSRRIEVECART